mgnify:CR=1 FL=1
MEKTSLSLLARLRRSPESENWNRLVDLYAPLIRAWLRKYDVQASDADDLVQEVFVAVSKDLGKFEHLEPEDLKLNPNGVVPTLVHDGAVLIESSAIIEYLDEILPEPPLAPSDPVGRAHMRAWLRYIEEVPTVAVRVPTFANILAPMRFAKTSDSEFRDHAAKLPLRKEFYERMSQDGFRREDFENAMDQLRQTCERIDAAIRETGGPWVMGEQFTQVDLLLMPAIDRMEDLG